MTSSVQKLAAVLAWLFWLWPPAAWAQVAEPVSEAEVHLDVAGLSELDSCGPSTPSCEASAQISDPALFAEGHAAANPPADESSIPELAAASQLAFFFGAFLPDPATYEATARAASELAYTVEWVGSDPPPNGVPVEVGVSVAGNLEVFLDLTTPVSSEARARMAIRVEDAMGIGLAAHEGTAMLAGINSGSGIPPLANFQATGSWTGSWSLDSIPQGALAYLDFTSISFVTAAPNSILTVRAELEAIADSDQPLGTVDGPVVVASNLGNTLSWSLSSPDPNVEVLPVLELPLDRDGDGVPDDVDACRNSDFSATVLINGCDSRVKNTLGEDGCTIADRIRLCAANAHNHGAFVACVARRMSPAAGPSRGPLLRCAARSNLPAN